MAVIGHWVASFLLCYLVPQASATWFIQLWAPEAPVKPKLLHGFSCTDDVKSLQPNFIHIYIYIYIHIHINKSLCWVSHFRGASMCDSWIFMAPPWTAQEGGLTR